MDKETLRMQMLAGVITESEYKAKVEKLAEGAFDNPNAPKIAEPQKGGSLQLKNAAMKIYSYIKKNGFTPYLMVDGKNIGDRMNHDFAIQVQGAGGHGASSSLAADGLLTISGNQNKTNPQVMEKLQNDIIHDFSFLTKHSQSNPSRLVIKLAVDPKANVSEELDEKDSLNESMIGGIVGIGAINQIPPRAKTDYEDAFEYFLSQKYPLNEAENAEAIGDKAEAAVKDEVKAKLAKKDPKFKEQLKAELARLGITANSTVEDVAQEIKPKIEESLNEAEGDTKEKLAKAFSDVGSGLMKSMLVPLIPLVVGQATDTGFAGGLAITAITAGALIALAKALGAEKSMEEGKEVEEKYNY
jgi:hypothetical protein